MNKKINFLNILKYIFLAILSFVSIFPFIWMIIATTNKSVELQKELCCQELISFKI